MLSLGILKFLCSIGEGNPTVFRSLQEEHAQALKCMCPCTQTHPQVVVVDIHSFGYFKINLYLFPVPSKYSKIPYIKVITKTIKLVGKYTL